MNHAIVSDLHIGSRYCNHELILRFIGSLPADCSLVLNGDTVDRWHLYDPDGRQRCLDAIVAESARRDIVWVRGNHDKRFEVPGGGRIEVKTSHAIGNRLYVNHGYDFDTVMPHNKAFIFVFRSIHRLRLRLGADHVHVAFYAKRFNLLYDVLRRKVRGNAVRFAKKNGFKAVTCGHTHYVEDVELDGVRYINTGAWTELPIYYLALDDSGMRLVEVAR